MQASGLYMTLLLHAAYGYAPFAAKAFYAVTWITGKLSDHCICVAQYNLPTAYCTAIGLCCDNLSKTQEGIRLERCAATA